MIGAPSCERVGEVGGSQTEIPLDLVPPEMRISDAMLTDE